jgi:hypothetical protein
MSLHATADTSRDAFAIHRASGKLGRQQQVIIAFLERAGVLGAQTSEPVLKRPAFQFYPADWRKDTALQLCSIGARGLWWEMICLMHEAVPYGHLVSSGKPVDLKDLSRLVGEVPKTVERYLDELRSREVFTVTEDGIICSRRMVRDEKERKAWRDRQGKHRDKDRDVTHEVTPPVTGTSRLSSSSSSSSSSKLGKATVAPVDNSQPHCSDKSEKGKVNGHGKKLGWWSDENRLKAKGAELGVNPAPGESTQAFRQRVFDKINHGKQQKPPTSS